MSKITNLIGTTWRINGDILGGILAGYGSFNITGYANFAGFMDGQPISRDMFPVTLIDVGYNYQSSELTPASEMITFSNDYAGFNYASMIYIDEQNFINAELIITGGEDISNPLFIDFINTYGTLVSGGEPPTAEGVKSKLQSLITASNAKTGKSDANLTDAVKTLLEGFGSGEGIFAEQENEHGTTVVLGADLQEKTIDITANGTVEVTPDEGYALKKVTAKVDVKGNDKIQRYIELNGNSAASLFYNFKGASVDELLDGIDTSKATSTNQMFANCSGITSVPTIDTGNSTDFSYMFAYDANLNTVPLLDSTKVTTVDSMFYQCKVLTDVPLFDTSKVTSFTSFFAQCESLKVIPAFDLRSTPIYSAFSSIVWRCYALTECWFRNIKHNIQVSDGSSWGHLLTVESLLHLCKECRMSTQARALTMGTANLAKLEGIYVKLIDITDEMRAEDDLIDEKYPFVQCESTDEGAMTIQDYMATKMWSLA